MSRAHCAGGFILLPVVLALTLLAAVAFLLNREGGMNASMAARGLDAAAARYAAEAGLTQINNATQNKDCAGYTNLSAVAFGTAQVSATVTPNSGTPVTLTASASTASGAAASLTRSNVVVHRTTPYVMILQPGADGVDAYIDSSKPTRNYGAATSFTFKDGEDRGLLKFDLSMIPPGAYIQTAQLGLYATNSSASSTDTLTIYRLTRAWTEGTKDGSGTADGATWNTVNGTLAWTAAGGDYDSASGVTTAFTGASGWNNFDVTPLVSNWAAGSNPNYGMLLVPNAGLGNGDFKSSDSAFSWLRPTLTVTYLPPCSWTPLTTLTLAPAADAHLNGTSPDSNNGSLTPMRIYESGQRRLLVDFDTSTVAAGTLLSSATLRLYVSSLAARSGGSMNLQVRALTSAWTESQVSWNRRTGFNNWTTPGGDFQGSNAATLAVPASFNGGWIEFNVTALAQAWVDGVTANNGAIVLETSADQFFVDSKEAGAATAPQLVIKY